MTELAKRQTRQINWGKVASDWGAVIATVLLFVFFSIALPGMFLTPGNIETILRSIAVTTVLAMGLTVTLAVGGFDLAAGNMASISGFFVTSLIVWYGISFWVASAYAILLTMLLTLLTMFLIVTCKIPDLLATCAMMFFLDGLALIYSGGGNISAGMPRPDGSASTGVITDIFKNIGKSPTIIFIMIACVLVVFVLLNFTKYGRFIYATGGNKTAAKLSGIAVRKYRIISGLISALFIALAGILVSSRNQSAQMGGVTAYQMPALAAVFIGRSVAGQGKPNAVGSLIGAILVGLLDNGLIMMGTPYYALNCVKGAVLAIALISTYYSTKED